MALQRQSLADASRSIQKAAFEAAARIATSSQGRRVTAALETRLLALMLAKTTSRGPKGGALGCLFQRHEPGHKVGEIYNDVFSPQRFEQGYRSQMGQDLFLNRWFFANHEHGFFVDVGAFDGELGSNTAFFEKKLGWSGLAFEPNPPAYAALKRNRSCQTIQGCAYDHDGEVSFLALSEKDAQRRRERVERPPNLFSMVLDPSHGGVMLSGIQQHIGNMSRVEGMRNAWDLDQKLVTVPCYRIDSRLKQAGVNTVDYLSIDVEGAELQVLQGIDFNSVQVNVIGIEHSREFKDVYNLLADANFEYHGLLFFDEIFVSQKPRYSWEN
jgi:FkbM family methyltransferase